MFQNSDIAHLTMNITAAICLIALAIGWEAYINAKKNARETKNLNR